MSRACHRPSGDAGETDGETTFALMGNPNVGKSSLFNAITGVGVSTAHYPGTTKEVQSALARAGARTVGVIDLPGTYAVSGGTEDARVARHALADLAPDAVVVVVDPAALARNLYLVIEVIELGVPVVVAVNLADEARRAGIEVDLAALSEALGVTAVLTVATGGVGIEALIDAVFAAADGAPTAGLRYSADMEALLEPLIEACEENLSKAPCIVRSARGEALSLLEGRPEAVERASARVLEVAASVGGAIKSHFGEDARVHVARERHDAARRVAATAVRRASGDGARLRRDLWALTTSPLVGVPVAIAVAAAIFGFLFFAGDALATGFSSLWHAYAAPPIAAAVGLVAGKGIVSKILLWGFDAGIEASLAIGLPYILTFYFLLGLLEDSGYLNSLAFLTDRLMHRFGLHGRAIVPLVAAAGCNVPALVAASQLGTKREQRIASTLVLYVPCSARTAVILGAVGHYIGLAPALLVLAVVAGVWLGAAFSLERIMPGESRGLVMEMFGFRRPSLRRVAAKAWEQFREFLFVATPIVIVGSLVLGGLYETGLLQKLSGPLAPVVQGWLGLPAIAGVTLIVGMLRKELALQLLVALSVATAGASGGLSAIMTPANLVVFALVNTIALPCISSVAVYARKQGTGYAAIAVGMSVVVAVVVGGLAARFLALVGFGA